MVWWTDAKEYDMNDGAIRLVFSGKTDILLTIIELLLMKNIYQTGSLWKNISTFYLVAIEFN